MADLLIKIGKNTEKEINRALKRSLSVDDRKKFQEQLGKIATFLGNPPTTKRHMKRPRDINQPPPSAVDQPPSPSAENHPIPCTSLAAENQLISCTNLAAENHPIPCNTLSNIQPVESPTPPGRQSDNYSSKNFDKKIAPQIRKGIAEYDRLHPHLDWNLELDFLDNTYNLKPTDLASTKQFHEQLVDREKTALNLHPLIAYHRGMCYLSAREYMPRMN
jgi:hypothetical protein